MLVLLAVVATWSFWPMAARVQDLEQEGDPGADVAPIAAESADPGRFMQVVAQGVLEIPAEVGWSVEKRRAVAPGRSEVTEQVAGFVLADTNAVVLVDQAGNVQQRLGPGEAAWKQPGELLSAVSSEEQGASFYAFNIVRGATDELVGEKFSLPAGNYDVDLLRGVLARGDEAPIRASAAPILLQVTSGSLFVQDEAGVVSEVGAGEPVLLAGENVLSGASRNPAAFVLARIGDMQETPLALGNMQSGTPEAGATPIAMAGATLRVAVLLCETASANQEMCKSPAAGLPLTVEVADSAPVARTANRQGEASFAGLTPGEVALSARLPGDAATRSVTCDPAGEEGPAEVTLSLGAGQEAACTWLLEAKDGETAVGTSLEVDIRACPEGMTVDRLEPAVCEPAEAGTWLTLEDRAGGIPLGVGEALPDRWRWDRLEPGSYLLMVEAAPDDFATFSFGETVLEEGEPGFPVRIPPGFVMRGGTLYLFPPGVPRMQSLTIDAWSCPPGMTGETLAPELCAVLVDGAELVLRENGAELPAFAAQDGVWVWTELGALPYDLEIASLPDVFTGGQLDDDCCQNEMQFPLRLSEGQPEARHALFLWQPFDDDPERDADGDGLPDVREVEAGTNPFLADNDEDGLGDPDEVDFYGTDPLAIDTDRDGLSDAEEVTVSFTNPFLADSDGDEVDDVDEVAAGTDPLEVLSLPGTPQPLLPIATAAPTSTPEVIETPVAEQTPGVENKATPIATPLVEMDAATEVTPAAVRSSISVATPLSTSGGASSGASRATSPQDALDGDGLPTLDELAIHGTNPTLADTDGDGVDDGVEITEGTDPRDANDR